MKKLLLAASGLFSAIPGLIIISKAIGTPPDYAYIFGGVIEAFGTLALLILWLNRQRLKSVRRCTITRWAIALGLLCLVFLIAYIALFKWCVVQHPTHGTVYYPLWTSGYLAEVVAKAGGRWQAVDHFGQYAVDSAIKRMPFYASLVTTSVLLLVYQGIFTSLTLAFGVVGFHEKADL